METHGSELVEGSESNSTGNVNTQLVTAMTRMTEYFEARIEKLEQPKLEATDDLALRRFQKLQPPKFDGEADVEKAENWMETLEDIYAALEYTEEQKVKFAAFQLKGTARIWWRTIDQEWKVKGKSPTWNSFLGEFRSKFIPLLVRERKEQEFMDLRQKTLTVAQYEVLFTKLSKYALEMINTEEKKIGRFWLGLNVELKRTLLPARIKTYADIVEMALRAEDCQDRINKLQSRKFDFRNSENNEGSSSQG